MTLPILNASPPLVIGGGLDAALQGSREGQKSGQERLKARGRIAISLGRADRA